MFVIVKLGLTSHHICHSGQSHLCHLVQNIWGSMQQVTQQTVAGYYRMGKPAVSSADSWREHT